MVSNESYFLQIDAHTLFEDEWDQTLINHLTEIKKYHSKPILTGYPNDFDADTLRKNLHVPNAVCLNSERLPSITPLTPSKGPLIIPSIGFLKKSSKPVPKFLITLLGLPRSSIEPTSLRTCLIALCL